MRAVVTLNLSNDVLSRRDSVDKVIVDGVGWNFSDLSRVTPADIRSIVAEQRKETLPRTRAHPELPEKITTDADKYIELAQVLFEDMPEVAAPEKNHVVFVGYMQDTQTPFVVTRLSAEQLTFRLLHRELGLLQDSTEALIKKLRDSKLGDFKDHQIRIYERQHNHVIITGRYIVSPFREALRSDSKEIVFVVLSVIFTVVTLLWIIYASSYPVLSNGVAYHYMERLSTAFVVTFCVSLVNFLQRWLKLKRTKLVEWSLNRSQ